MVVAELLANRVALAWLAFPLRLVVVVVAVGAATYVVLCVAK